MILIYFIFVIIGAESGGFWGIAPEQFITKSAFYNELINWFLLSRLYFLGIINWLSLEHKKIIEYKFPAV